MPSELTDRSVIALAGPEATTFLQGLITNDAALIAPGRPLYAALLTPQGKILFDFLVHADGDTLLIDCHHLARPALMKRLSLYKLRTKVEIAPRDDLMVVTSGPPDPRLGRLGGRSVIPREPGTAAGTDAYLALRLELGVPEAADFGSDRMFALDAGLDELHAISFTKGCYVGQELTARMKHRGTDRKRLLPVHSLIGALPAAATPVMAGEGELGTLLSSYGRQGFALLRLDRLAEAAAPITAAGMDLSVAKPDWLFT